MRVFRNLLIGLGTLFLVVIAFITWIGVSSIHFQKQQAPFVERFVRDLSKRWDFADVRDRMTDTFIEESDTPQAQRLLDQFKQLGELKSIHSLELPSYKAATASRTGVFSFRGTFQSGEGAVRLVIVEKDGVSHVAGFELRGVHTGPSKAQI